MMASAIIASAKRRRRRGQLAASWTRKDEGGWKTGEKNDENLWKVMKTDEIAMKMDEHGWNDFQWNA